MLCFVTDKYVASVDSVGMLNEGLPAWNVNTRPACGQVTMRWDVVVLLTFVEASQRAQQA